jgi:hypothetical protein
MIRHYARKALALAVPVLALVSSSTASAGAIAGFGGTARLNSAVGCFIESWGSAYNTCSGNTDINYTLPVSSSGTNTVRIYTTTSSVSTANLCKAISIGPTGGVSVGNAVNMQVGTAKYIESSVYIPSWGAEWVVCTVPSGGQILHVHN